MYYITYFVDRLFVAFCISLFYTFFSFFVMYAVAKLKKDEDILDRFGDIWGYLYFVNTIIIFIILVILRIEL